MNEMIERVARTLSPQSWQALNTKCDTKAKAKRREASIDYAKRVIKAMREPTDEMVNNTHGYIDEIIVTWQSMIDEILK